MDRLPPWKRQEHNLEIGIEMHPTVVPIPLGITIRDKVTKKCVGSVDADEARRILAKWDAMVLAYEKW